MAVARGSTFLDRQVKRGSVLYLALEEQDAMLYEQFVKSGVREDDDIKLHIGGVNGDNALDQLYEYAAETKPSLIIVDTLMLLAQLKDSNSYDEVNPAMAKFRKLARDTGTHVCCIHHQNKSADGGTGSILGSSAIHGALDCAMIFNVIGLKRYITTSQRGGVPFYNREVVFDTKTETYKLGEEANEF
jgi:RecA-family ATPase